MKDISYIVLEIFKIVEGQDEFEAEEDLFIYKQFINTLSVTDLKNLRKVSKGLLSLSETELNYRSEE